MLTNVGLCFAGVEWDVLSKPINVSFLTEFGITEASGQHDLNRPRYCYDLCFDALLDQIIPSSCFNTDPVVRIGERTSVETGRIMSLVEVPATKNLVLVLPGPYRT